MTRVQGWEKALFNLTVERHARAHEWGVHDCALFAADCVRVMTGADPMADIRGTYTTRIGAARAIKKLGVDTLAEAVTLQLPSIVPSMAQRGDVVLCNGSDGEFLAIVQGITAVGPSRRGLIHVPVSQALAAWRVE